MDYDDYCKDWEPYDDAKFADEAAAMGAPIAWEEQQADPYRAVCEGNPPLLECLPMWVFNTRPDDEIPF